MDISKRLIRLAKEIISENDPMEKEQLSKLFLKFEGWIIKETDKRPSSAPIVTQLIEGLGKVKDRLLKMNHSNWSAVTGREAVLSMCKAMRGLFTVDAVPLGGLRRKYGDEIRLMLAGRITE